MSSLENFLNPPMFKKIQQQQEMLGKVLYPSRAITQAMSQITLTAQRAAHFHPNAWEANQKIMSTPIAGNLAAYEEMSKISSLAQLINVVRQQQDYQNIINSLNTDLTDFSLLNIVDFDSIIEQEDPNLLSDSEISSTNDLTDIEEEIIIKLSNDTSLIEKIKKRCPQLSSKTAKDIARYIFEKFIVPLLVTYIASKLF